MTEYHLSEAEVETIFDIWVKRGNGTSMDEYISAIKNRREERISDRKVSLDKT